MAAHSRVLAWKIPGTGEPGRLQSMGLPRVGHDWVTSLSLFTFMHWRRKWQPTPGFLPGKSQGQGSLVGCRLWGRKVGHDWSDLAVASRILYLFKRVLQSDIQKFQWYRRQMWQILEWRQTILAFSLINLRIYENNDFKDAQIGISEDNWENDFKNEEENLPRPENVSSFLREN